MSKGSTPSGNTTTTTIQQNPTADLQRPFLGDLWGAAAGLAQQPSSNIGALQGYAQGQGDAAQTAGAGSVFQTATNQYLNQLLRGVPSQAQAAQLTANAADAVNQGLGYSQSLANAANSALSQSPQWQSAFWKAGADANAGLQGYGTGALNALSGVGNLALNTLPGMGQSATSALTGLAPGALGGLSSLSGQAGVAGNPAISGLNANAAMALANPGLSSGLQGLASGAYINPATNPAYAGMIQAATQPLVNQYMTATAPQLASQFERAGRYGSGAQTNAQGQAQYGLGQALGNAVSNITNNAYGTGLQATLGGGQALGNIYNTGVGNITQALSNAGQLAQGGTVNAANILNQGYGTAGNLLNQGYTTGGNLINQGLGAGANALSNAYQIGGGLSQQGYNTLNSFMQNAASQGLGYLNAGLSGLGSGANAAQAGYGTANTGLSGAGNMLDLGSSALTNALAQAQGFATYPQSEYTQAYNAPWLPLNNLSAILNGVVPGSGTTTATSPYYNNTAANVLSGLTGGLGIANQIGGANGLFPGAISSLFSGGGAVAPAALAQMGLATGTSVPAFTDAVMLAAL